MAATVAVLDEACMRLLPLRKIIVVGLIGLALLVPVEEPVNSLLINPLRHNIKKLANDRNLLPTLGSDPKALC